MSDPAKDPVKEAPEAPAAAATWRSLPNLLTLGRVALIVPFVAAFWLPHPAGWWLALGLFAAASVTDFFDGWLARRSGLTSDFGRFLDPVADKLLVTAALVILAATGQTPGVHVVAVVAILLREVAVSALREFLAARQAIVHVSGLAKGKTTVQMAAIAVLLLAPALAVTGTPSPGGALHTAGLVLLWLAAALTVWTGAEYFAGAARRPDA